nr:hypothetical protein [uncultured Sphaerochaeta sp.]
MNPRTKYISKAEFAKLIGVNRSQVTRACQSGRIKESKEGKIDWKQATIDWESSRSDSLAGTGRANNKAKARSRKVKTGLPEPTVKDIPDYSDVDNMPEEDDYYAPKNSESDDDITLVKAKIDKEVVTTDRQRIRLNYEKGVSIDRDDALLVYIAILNGVKTGVLSLPARYAQGTMRIIDKHLSNAGVKITSAQRAKMLGEITTMAAKEANYVLTQVRANMEKSDEETKKIVERYITTKKR